MTGVDESSALIGTHIRLSRGEFVQTSRVSGSATGAGPPFLSTLSKL